MSKNAETVVRNIVYILILELILFPAGVFLWLYNGGWHIYHVALAIGYVQAISLITETANLLLKDVRVVDVEKVSA